MKKLMSLLLVFAMLVCYLPAGAFAAEAGYYVAGTAELCGGAWECDNASNKMSLNEDGLYEKTYAEVPAGDHAFKVTDGTWDNSWGKNGDNFDFTTEKVQEVKITFNADTKEILVYLDGELLVDAPVAEASYFVAGVAELCGNAWACKDEANKMELDEDGLYKKTYEKVPAGTYEFKVTDGTWDNSWGNNGANYSFTTTEEKNVTITFNADTKEIGVVLKDVVVENFYTVAGSDSLCGSGWNPADINNKMSLNADGLYEKYFFNVPAGTHEFKITNGSWDLNWGADGVAGGANISFTTTDVMNVRITFDDVNFVIAYELIPVSYYTVAGTDSLCGSGWNPGDEANQMYLDVDGLYKKTFKSVPAGTHECKVTDGSWSNSWGVDGGNYVFETDDVYDITITFNEETKEVGHVLSAATTPDPVFLLITPSP